ncbi:antA/AntB antirepressor family protein [Clostridium botulinum]|nr:antA/AntB antirepressor family protein [Clostridium botulinum]EKS4395904.1 antA/AntB antirepressor family protein [Clostridium botulinum]
MKKTKTSKNLKKGKLNKEELKLYDLEDKEISMILEYQEKLPVLQGENENWINARTIHNELGVGRDFTTWIKQQIGDLDLEEDKEYNIKWIKGSDTFKGDASNSNRMVALGYNKEYLITIEIAKEIAMVAGAKGGRTGKELKERSKIARKYFIYIEKAFKNRYEWNLDRKNTLIKCKTLKSALIKHKKEVIKTIPKYMHNNQFIAEFCLLNEVIIGMSAKEYRKRKGFAKDFPIRNSFNEKELELVHILEQYDSDLIGIQNEFNYEDRRKFLTKKLKSII